MRQLFSFLSLISHGDGKKKSPAAIAAGDACDSKLQDFLLRRNCMTPSSAMLSQAFCDLAYFM